jgi:hypothetical protein
MHKAIIAKVTHTAPIPGADKIHVAYVLGEAVIVSKDVVAGYTGTLFPADLQLSEQYCYENNLNRKSEKNKDITKSGFFDENRKVRVQPFLKVRSQAYFADIKSLNYIKSGLVFDIGYTFDTIEGVQVCQKYISKATREARDKQNKPKQAKVTYAPYFEKHKDTEQFKHYAAMIPKGALLSFHAKIHGTSKRCSYTLVTKELPKWKQLVNKIYPIFPAQEYAHVVGTRNTVLTENKDGFHGSEQFRFDVAKSLEPYMEKGMTIYGEIFGFVNGKPIMAVHQSSATKDKAFQKKYGKDIIYRYGCMDHEFGFHIYRITYSTPEHKNIDFSAKQVEEWCDARNIRTTFEVAPQEIYDGDVDKLIAKVEALTERPELLGEDYIDSSHPSEGIIIRIDDGNLTPKFLKSKAYFFRTM